MMKSLFRALGIGGASINAVLDTDRVQPGGSITGTLHVQGGDHGQTATKATVELVARVMRKYGDDEHAVDEVIARTELPGPIPLGGAIAAPFRLDLPPYTPVTSMGGNNHVWVRSVLDVPWALDPGDADRLEVHPTLAQANVVAAMQQLGFRLFKVDIEPRSSWFGRSWVQEFEFKPTQYGRSKYAEVEIVFEKLHGAQAEVLMQLDRASRGLGGLLMELSGTDESWVRVTLDASSPQAAASSLQRYIH
jgi:sporulation-control protein